MIAAPSPNLRRRKLVDRLFTILAYSAAVIGVALLLILLSKLFADGLPRLSGRFLTSMPKQTNFAKAGILSAIIGSVWVMVLTFLFAVPIGVGAAVYLQEFQTKKSRFTGLIQVNINNLSGVPSIVYGMLGLAIFVPLFTALTRDPLQGRGIITGALTMSLLILPMIILVTQESLKSVPKSFREGSLSMGATNWQTIRKVVLPAASPGILTGIILAMGRAVGETAPLIVVGAASLVTFLPRGLTDGYMVLPLQIYDWSSRPQAGFHQLAASAIVVLIVALVAINSIAITIRARSRHQV
ncbi:MAG: phosphate ABC transporter permease PstA [Armatimonadetes bacterium]|nr:phosphate ABC transporter permease PstA [Armatimonadota bacterium]